MSRALQGIRGAGGLPLGSPGPVAVPECLSGGGLPGTRPHPWVGSVRPLAGCLGGYRCAVAGSKGRLSGLTFPSQGFSVVQSPVPRPRSGVPSSTGSRDSPLSGAFTAEPIGGVPGYFPCFH